MSDKEQMTAIQEHHSRRGHIFWVKVYTFTAISLLSAFVIIYVHFGHHFGVNNEEAEDIDIFPMIQETIELNVDYEIEDESTLIANESNSVIEVDSDNELELNGNDQDISAMKYLLGEQFLIVNGKLDAFDRSYSSLNTNIQGIIKTNDKVEGGINILSDEVNLIHEEVFDIHYQISTIKTDVALIINTQDEMKNQLNNIMNAINDLTISLQTPEKSKKEKEKKKNNK